MGWGMIPRAHFLAEDIEDDEERRHAYRRALRGGHSERPPAWSTRLAEANLRTEDGDRHALANDPCRLIDGSIGRMVFVLSHEGWTLACRPA